MATHTKIIWLLPFHTKSIILKVKDQKHSDIKRDFDENSKRFNRSYRCKVIVAIIAVTAFHISQNNYLTTVYKKLERFLGFDQFHIV